MQMAKDDDNTPLKYALKYAAMGWKVFPLHYILENGQCSCGNNICENQGKHPATLRGVNDATSDPEKIKNLFRNNKQNVAAEADPHWVHDIDPRNGGDKTWADFTKDKVLPDTAIQVSGGGGTHYLWLVPDGRKLIKPGRGVDIKKSGGYIVVEPSNHHSGGEYYWEGEYSPLEGQKIAEAPEWMLEPLEQVNLPQGVHFGTGYLTPSQIRDLRACLPYINAGDRDIWVQVGASLHSTQAPQAFGLWNEWSRLTHDNNYDADDCVRVWNSFKANGGANIESIFFKAQQSGWVNGSPMVPLVPQENAPSFFIDANQVKSRKADWLVKDHFELNTLACLFGDPGCGKSFVAIDVSMAVATGQKWAGKDTKKGVVIYIAGEGQNGLKKRIDAWQKYHKTQLPDNALFFSMGAALLKDPQNAIYIKQQIEGVVAAIDGESPVLIVIDTLARNMGGDENSTAEMNEFISNLDRHIREPFGSCLLVVHHTGHADKTRARGAMSFKGALDTEFLVNKDGDKMWLKCTKMKDFKEPAPAEFSFQTVELEYEEESAVVVPTFNFDAFLDLERGQKTAWDLFEGAWLEFGTVEDGSAVLTANALKDHINNKDWDSDSHRRQAFSRNKKRLIDSGIVEQIGEKFKVIKTSFDHALQSKKCDKTG